jgi:hypothetical protein
MMDRDRDVAIVANAARALDIRPRGRRWTHLPVCVLDAVFSINARYCGTIAVCDRYAAHQHLAPHLLPLAEANSVIGTEAEQPVDALADLGHQLGLIDLPRRCCAIVAAPAPATASSKRPLDASAATPPAAQRRRHW